MFWKPPEINRRFRLSPHAATRAADAFPPLYPAPRLKPFPIIPIVPLSPSYPSALATTLIILSRSTGVIDPNSIPASPMVLMLDDVGGGC